MGKSAPTPPPAPDYVGAAQAQGQANIAAGQQTASLSNPNVTNPYGSQTVTYTPTGPNGDMQPNVNQSLNPQAQQTLDAQQRVQTGLANLGEKGLGVAQNVLGQPFHYSGPDIQTSLGNLGQANGQLNTSGIAQMPVNAGTTGQQAIMSRLQPQIDQQNKALQQQLANQGISGGSEAYGNAMRVQNQGNNDLYTQAALQGIGLDMSANQQGYNQALQSGQFGNQAQLQNYEQALGAGQFGNTAAAQALQQQMGLYNQPLNQITALMSGSQIQAPQFQQYQGSNIQAAPIANATSQLGQYNQGIYGQQMAGYNASMQGLGSALGGAAGMFSFAPIAL
jgi:hypothetical protein